MASRSFIRSTQAVLYWTPISRESWRAALPFTEFAENQMAISIFLKLSLRAWNTVPEVTLNTVLFLGALEAIAAHRVAPQRSALGAISLALCLMPAQALKPVVGSRIPHPGEIEHRQRSALWREQEVLALGRVFGFRHGSTPPRSGGRSGVFPSPRPRH
jgi:hypothetical protein